MAVITVSLATPSLAGQGVGMSIVKAGVAATVCLPVYRAATGRYHIADYSSADTADVAGIVDMVSTAADDYMSIVTSGKVNITTTTTLVVGTTFFLGAFGAIVNYEGVTVGKYITVLGTAITTTAIELAIGVTGNTK